MIFQVHYSYDEETKQYIATMVGLRISDYGLTIEEAEENLMKAVGLCLDELKSSPSTKNIKKVTSYISVNSKKYDNLIAIKT
ncbi:hypothetical protein HON22_02630 [Candidatus Peregrinibacteria bacterium]|nr:hypothetical protein [Candidatus Peregrinibacteria bacterium]